MTSRLPGPAIAAGLAFWVLYLLVAGSVSVTELAVGVLLGVLLSWWAYALSQVSPRGFIMTRAHLRAWSRAIGTLPRATIATGAMLARALALRDPASRAVERPFRQGRGDDPAERGRRATAVLAASLAPASFVIRAAPGEARALFHALPGAPLRDDPEWLS